MKKQLAIIISALSLSACGTLAIMDKSEAVQAQPEMLIKTDGDFWGFGAEGDFTLGNTYRGKYSRDASSSTWFDTVSTKDGNMVAEISNIESGETWLLNCSGGGTSVNLGVLELGGNQPYRCEIENNGQIVGQYSMQRDSKVIDFSTEDKETGHISLGPVKYDVETVHTGPGLLLPLETALGYRFINAGQEVAAVQTNGILTVQWLPSLNEQQKDVLAIGAIASALSWRPAE
ncbi:hypothetical protein VISI1226_10039 [Vibrio sinaloensis DSM 21326]|uniref:Lipoprotein n=1 Tax=Vibrio sinaloensis DSM 21326 TaxID=945550 RepID=E8M876_PHOS4|nr:hypothetical protein [Vibrio sinaloensis]EGA69768.1 hypothetical protein VISI1226_10039 [Vibrio sinaloensis DSM 21326]